MPIAWLIEDPSAPSIAAELCGNIAIRLVASMASVRRLAQIQRHALPSLVVVNPLNIQFNPKLGPLMLAEIFPSAKLMVLSADDVNSCGSGLVVGRALELLQDTQTAQDILRYKDIALNIRQFAISYHGEEDLESLTKKEAMILHLLLQKAGLCVSRDEIKTAVWDQLVVTERTIDCHISRLRKRLQGSTVTIESIYGGGYTLL